MSEQQQINGEMVLVSDRPGSYMDYRSRYGASASPQRPLQVVAVILPGDLPDQQLMHRLWRFDPVSKTHPMHHPMPTRASDFPRIVLTTRFGSVRCVTLNDDVVVTVVGG